MSLDHFVSVFSAAIAFAGLLLVAIQMRSATRQREAESLVKIYDVNRELITLGFSHPQLFNVVDDGADDNPAPERRYLQLWLNQFALIHLFLNRLVFDADLKEALERDLGDFLKMKTVRQHWQTHGVFYPASFQNLVNGMIAESAPRAAGDCVSGDEHLAGDLLERGAGHPHEALANGRGQLRSLGEGRDVALHEHVPGVGKDCGRARGATAKLSHRSIFSDNFLNRHSSGIVEFFQSLKQNYTNCFNPEWGGAFV